MKHGCSTKTHKINQFGFQGEIVFHFDYYFDEVTHQLKSQTCTAVCELANMEYIESHLTNFSENECLFIDEAIKRVNIFIGLMYKVNKQTMCINAEDFTELSLFLSRIA